MKYQTEKNHAAISDWKYLYGVKLLYNTMHYDNQGSDYTFVAINFVINSLSFNTIDESSKYAENRKTTD